MNKILTLFLLCSVNSFSQADSEVILLELVSKGDSILLKNEQNISSNKGYDNQPSFYSKKLLVYASTRKNQTDVLQYNTSTQEKKWLTSTGYGSEYSPQKIMGDEALSAIRLDSSGLQRLYRYDLKEDTSVPIHKSLKIGYHVWYKKDLLIATVLVADRMDLVYLNLKDGSEKILALDVGRSLHKIPKSNAISFISNKNNKSVLTYMDMNTFSTQTLFSFPEGVSDLCWLNEHSILFPNKNSIMLHQFKKNLTKEIYSFSSNLTTTRMTVSPEQNMLAVVVEEK
jgi:hypothetical protein